MKGRPASITPTDWEMELLHIFWDRNELSVDNVREILRSKRIFRAESSVRSILQVMLEKRLLKATVQKNVTRYSAAVKRNQVEKKALHHLADSLFRGNGHAMALRALDETNITPELIQDLEMLIEKHSGKTNKP